MSTYTEQQAGHIDKAYSPDDEPIFVLRAQDILAPDCIIRWIEQCQAHGVNKEKIDDALTILGAMLRWKGRKKLPD